MGLSAVCQTGCGAGIWPKAPAGSIRPHPTHGIDSLNRATMRPALVAVLAVLALAGEHHNQGVEARREGASRRVEIVT